MYHSSEDVTPRLESRHMAIVVCPWVGPSFSKSNQELARYFDIIARLKKKRNPQPLLDYKVSRNPNSRKSIEILSKFHLFFGLKPPIKKAAIHKSINTNLSVRYLVRKVFKDHHQHQTWLPTQQPHQGIKIITNRQIKVQSNNTISDKVKIRNKFKTQHL